MPKPYSLDLRERVVRYVDEGHSRHAAAAHFRVSVSFVVNLVKAFRMRGKPRAQAQRRAAPCQARTPSGVSLGEGRREGRHHHAGAGGRLAAATCQKVDPASLSRWLIRIGYRFKKNSAGQRA